MSKSCSLELENLQEDNDRESNGHMITEEGILLEKDHNY